MSEEERFEFLRYDTHGGDLTRSWGSTQRHNPILGGKSREGILGNYFHDDYFGNEMVWPGGLVTVSEMHRLPHGLRFLERWFGKEAVTRWCQALFASWSSENCHAPPWSREVEIELERALRNNGLLK